jgi:CO dehydrogenase maturation factor
MGRKVVSTRRGGASKTTFAALDTRYLSGPLLLIDIDPDQSLADMLGIDLEKEVCETFTDDENKRLETRKILNFRKR